MTSTIARRSTQRVLAVLGGAIVGSLVALSIVFFFSQPVQTLGTTTCSVHVLQDVGFDPWTGAPRGRTARVNCIGDPRIVTDPIPADRVGQRGFPWATVLVVTLGIGGALMAPRLLHGRPESGPLSG